MSGFDREITGPVQIGKYPILDKLGEGGFGVVYRANDPNIERDVAIKILMHSDEVNIARFRAEAATVGKLDHPNIVTVYDFGEHEGRPYIVMQLLDGHDLKDVIESFPRKPLFEVMDLMSQVASGLHYAHERKVIHRDVKPANIRLLPDRTIRIMDFGIARITENLAAGLTGQGNIVGSLKYMAPERLDGGECDRRVDIFAYGIVYYQLLTGIHPFDVPSLPEVIDRIRRFTPERIRNIDPRCPPELEAAIFRALEKDPARRYRTLHEFELDLDRTLSEVRRDRAASLAGQARTLATEGKGEEASSLISQALKLDSGNETARRLRDELRQSPVVTIPSGYVPPQPAVAAKPRASWKLAAGVAACVLVAAVLILFLVTRSTRTAPVQKASPPPAPASQPQALPVANKAPVEPPGQPETRTAKASRPRLFARPSSLAFTVAEGAAVSPFEVLDVSPGQAPFSFTAMPEQSWIVLRSGEDRAPGKLHVAVDPRSLPPGDHNGTLTLLAGEAAGGPIRIDLRVHVASR